MIIDGFSVHSCDKCRYLLDEDKCNILDSLPDFGKKLPSDVIMTLIYIAGYIGRSEDEIHDTYFYYEINWNYLKDMNRGGLKIKNVFSNVFLKCILQGSAKSLSKKSWNWVSTSSKIKVEFFPQTLV